MNLEQFGSIFPLGSHLCREPMPPMSEMKRDMENLKSKGFNLIKLQEQWAMDEPAEGEYDFSKYEELIEYAARLDLGVYLGLTCEEAPGWLWRKFPDCSMERRDGLRIVYQAQTAIPGDGKPGPCFDHPGAMEAQLNFIRSLVRKLGVYENIVVWNTWQEIGYAAERLAGGSVCYCPHTISFFQKWLVAKYGDLDTLNREWKSRYKDWCNVIPNRFVGKFGNPNDVAWRYFMENVQIPGILEKRAQAIKEADLLKRPVFSHQGSSTVGSGVDWTYARSQDFFGCSVYPSWFHRADWDDSKNDKEEYKDKYENLLNEMWESVALKIDYLRSCSIRGNQFWAAEFQGGPICTGLYKGRVPSADDIRRWMLTAAGSGITGISFWVTRAEIQAHELNGYSLLDSSGDSTERYEEVSRIGQALNRHADIFGKSTHSPAKAAILINEWSYQLCSELQGRAEEHLAYSVRGWHKFLWELGIPVDFIETMELDEKYFHKYKAIILPFPLSISEGVASKLSDYVRDGGNLICEACPGRVNENAFANRSELSEGMKSLLGVEYENLIMVREPSNGRRWTTKELSWGDLQEARELNGMGPFEGSEVRANLYVETYKCNGSSPILKSGDSAAGTVNNYGKGKAWLIGTFIGHNATAYREDATKRFIKALLKECGVFPEHQGRLLMRKRALKNKQAWILTNPEEQDITEAINVNGAYKVTDLWDKSLTIKDGSVSLDIKSLDVRVLILEFLND